MGFTRTFPIDFFVIFLYLQAKVFDVKHHEYKPVHTGNLLAGNFEYCVLTPIGSCGDS